MIPEADVEKPVDLPKCACGNTDVIGISPGFEGEELMGMTITRGQPAQAWCLEHWPWREKIE